MSPSNAAAKISKLFHPIEDQVGAGIFTSSLEFNSMEGATHRSKNSQEQRINALLTIDSEDIPRLETTISSHPISDFLDLGDDHKNSYEEKVYNALESKYQPKKYREKVNIKTTMVKDGDKEIPLSVMIINENRKALMNMLVDGCLDKELKHSDVQNIKD